MAGKMSRPKSAVSGGRDSSGGHVRQMTLDNIVNDDVDDEGDPLLEEKPIRRRSAQQPLRPDPILGKESLSDKSKPEVTIPEGSSVGSEDEAEDDDVDDDDENGSHLEGVYKASDYEDLSVSAEMKELFQYITRYTPQVIELEHRLKPFIPDFIPAVGDIDAFIKVSRPDGKSDTLGLTVIDEPSAKQSDPTVLNLQLRALSKEFTSRAVTVKTLQDADKNGKEIDSWIKSISDLHRSKPPPAVHYSRNMPSIDSLMQEWDPEIEELLKVIKLPSADVDCDLTKYVEIVCNILDIPVYKSRIQSLHVMFSLYLAFKKHQHFQNSGNEADMAATADDGIDRLFLQ